MNGLLLSLLTPVQLCLRHGRLSRQSQTKEPNSVPFRIVPSTTHLSRWITRCGQPRHRKRRRVVDQFFSATIRAPENSLPTPRQLPLPS